MSGDSQEIQSKAELVEALEAGNKPPEDWRIGTEHEKFTYHLEDCSALEYGGDNGVAALLEGMRRFDWEPAYEGENIVALTKDGASVTLEPGGQFELSGKTLETIHQTCDEVHTHLDEVKQVGDDLGVGFIGLGFHPTLTRDAAPLMPKGRYNIMRAYMQTKGSLGLDMMHRTCTVQVNLDFSSEADMVKKFRVALALQPLATALFANSPFTEGKPNGFKSYRSHIWTDTDPDRTGMLPFVFEEGFGFERWVDYMLDVPLYFAHRETYIDASGQSFRDFMAGRLPALPGEVATMADWEDHLTTTFPEVRLKTFLEMRGADGGPWSKLCALPALWVGLLYDQSALDAAWDMVKDWSLEEMEALRREVPRRALEAPFRGGTLLDVARPVMEMAQAGLKARARSGKKDADETEYLDTLLESVESGRVPADDLLDAYHGEWQGDISRVFRDFSY